MDVAQSFAFAGINRESIPG